MENGNESMEPVNGADSAPNHKTRMAPAGGFSTSNVIIQPARHRPPSPRPPRGTK